MINFQQNIRLVSHVLLYPGLRSPRLLISQSGILTISVEMTKDIITVMIKL